MYRKALTSDSLSKHGFFGAKLPSTPSNIILMRECVVVGLNNLKYRMQKAP